jgi:hypothetical protein
VSITIILNASSDLGKEAVSHNLLRRCLRRPEHLESAMTKGWHFQPSSVGVQHVRGRPPSDVLAQGLVRLEDFCDLHETLVAAIAALATSLASGELGMASFFRRHSRGHERRRLRHLRELGAGGHATIGPANSKCRRTAKSLTYAMSHKIHYVKYAGNRPAAGLIVESLTPSRLLLGPEGEIVRYEQPSEQRHLRRCSRQGLLGFQCPGAANVQDFDTAFHECRRHEPSSMAAAGVFFGAHDGRGFVLGKSDELCETFAKVGLASPAVVVEAAGRSAVSLSELSA